MFVDSPSLPSPDSNVVHLAGLGCPLKKLLWQSIKHCMQCGTSRHVTKFFTMKHNVTWMNGQLLVCHKSPDLESHSPPPIHGV